MHYAIQRLRAIVAALILAAVCSSLTVASAQTVYDAVTDFSIESSTGIWSYGHTATRSSQFSPYNIRYTDYFSSALPGFDMWTTNLPNAEDPYIMYNGTGTTRTYFQTVRHPADLLNLTPGSDGSHSVVRWTAPASGLYHIASRFRCIDLGSPNAVCTPDVAVLYNGSELFSDNLHGFNDERNFTGLLYVEMGETVDFSVGYGTNPIWNDHYFDSTGLSAIIRPFAISGRVTDEAGQGLGGVEVMLESGAQRPITATTDADGRYTFNLTRAGRSYTVTGQLSDCERRHFRYEPKQYIFRGLNEPQTATFVRRAIECPSGTICLEEPPCPL